MRYEIFLGFVWCYMNFAVLNGNNSNNKKVKTLQLLTSFYFILFYLICHVAHFVFVLCYDGVLALQIMAAVTHTEWLYFMPFTTSNRARLVLYVRNSMSVPMTFQCCLYPCHCMSVPLLTHTQHTHTQHTRTYIHTHILTHTRTVMHAY